ncbi:phage holin family protein [Streptomyces sp. G-5]|nr:phage holin family protein [Streptomyces sp. G-5]MCU4746256.1 phage holin family protein [Streptomyces sp. G-5]
MRSGGAALLRVLVVWGVSAATMVVLAVILPDFRLQSPDGDSLTRVAATALLGAGAFGILSALVWPWLVRTLLLVPALALACLVFLLNGSLLLFALSLIPYGRGEASPQTAVIVAAVMSLTSSATSTWLAVRDQGAQRRRLHRMAPWGHPAGGWGRARDAGGPDASGVPRPAGTVFLQLDGIGHALLREAIAGDRPLMPSVAALCGTSHRLTRWRTDWSSQTGASQLGILHGSNEDVPAFRWYEKERGEVIVSNRPSSAAELQRRAAARAGHPGLLAADGASRGNLFTGGAGQAALVVSIAVRRGKGERSRAGYFAYFSDPAHAARTVLSFAAELVREICQSVRARLRGVTPRVGRGGLYPMIRAFATVVERDVVTASVVGDILTGRTAVYADLVAYDEVAHHSGPRSPDVRQVLRRLDDCVATIGQAIAYAPRPYHLVLLSDHGQSQGEPFEAAYGHSLEELVRIGCGRPLAGEPRRARHKRRERRAESGAEARAVARSALHRPEEPPEPPEPVPGAAAGPGEERRRAPVVLGSGNLGLVSFPEIPGRATRSEIASRYPALLSTLAEHPGIGFVLVRDQRYGAVVLGGGGGEHRLASGEVIGPDPLAPFGAGAAEAVLRTDRFPHTADLMINSSVDPVSGAIHAFEDQVGSHGGLGGEQSHAFLLSPHALSDPLTGDGDGGGEGAAGGELVGAESVHRVLRRWLAESAQLSGRTDAPSPA